MEDAKFAQIKLPPEEDDEWPSSSCSSSCSSSASSLAARNSRSLVANGKVEFETWSSPVESSNSATFGNVFDNFQDIAIAGIASNGQEVVQHSANGMLPYHGARSIDRTSLRIDNNIGSPFSSPKISSHFNDYNLPKVKVRPEAHEPASASPQTPKVIYSPEVRTPLSAHSANESKQVDMSRGLIDTTAPFESVREAASKFGGTAKWKANKLIAVERHKLVEQELEKVQEEMPEYRRQTVVAEVAKTRILKELDSTKRLIEKLKLNLERAQTEEHQAKKDSELARLRVQQLEQGIADEVRVAAKEQLEVAEARHSAAVSEMKSVNYELETLRKEYTSLVAEKDEAWRKAEEAISRSKEVEKIVEELAIELISAQESLESAHAAHLEAEEQKIGVTMAREQDVVPYGKELKHAQDELQKLNRRVLSGKDLKSKLDAATTLLLDLKAELATYMGSKLAEDIAGKRNTSAEKQEMENRSRTDDIQATVASAKKELQEVKFNIQKATDEVNYLKLAATSLQSEMEKEKSALATIRRRRGTGIGHDKINMREAKEKMVELPKKLQEAAQAADEAKQLALMAREEMHKAKEEAEQAKAEVSTMESKLVAAQKEIEAAKASEKLALAAIKALQVSEPAHSTKDMDSPAGITLSLEEYYELSKRAHDAEELEFAKESEMKASKIAVDKAEKALEEKLGREKKSRTWRPEDDQRRKTGEPYQAAVKSTKSSFEAADSSPEYVDTTKGDEHENFAEAESPDEKGHKKTKRSFFPRFLMFFTSKRFFLPIPGKGSILRSNNRGKKTPS